LVSEEQIKQIREDYQQYLDQKLQQSEGFVPQVRKFY
jgi:hypothetical protein